MSVILICGMTSSSRPWMLISKGPSLPLRHMCVPPCSSAWQTSGWPFIRGALPNNGESPCFSVVPPTFMEWATQGSQETAILNFFYKDL